MVEQWKCWWFSASKPCSDAQAQTEWWSTTVNTACSMMMTTSFNKMSRPAADFLIQTGVGWGVCLSFTVNVRCLLDCNRPDGLTWNFVMAYLTDTQALVTSSLQRLTDVSAKYVKDWVPLLKFILGQNSDWFAPLCWECLKETWTHHVKPAGTKLHVLHFCIQQQLLPPESSCPFWMVRAVNVVLTT